MYCAWPPSRESGTTAWRAGSGDRCAVVEPHQVQAQVDPGGGPGRGEDVALVDEQHVGVDGRARAALDQQLRGLGMHGSQSAVVGDVGEISTPLRWDRCPRLPRVAEGSPRIRSAGARLRFAQVGTRSCRTGRSAPPPHPPRKT
jgi:hypothetical protein